VSLLSAQRAGIPGDIGCPFLETPGGLSGGLKETIGRARQAEVLALERAREASQVGKVAVRV
jgi:hypothetical protein